jgi:hypothetical protein
MDARLERMDARLEGMDARLEGMDARLEGMDARLEETNGHLRDAVGVLGGTLEVLTHVHQGQMRMTDALERFTGVVATRLGTHDDEIASIRDRVARLERQVFRDLPPEG